MSLFKTRDWWSVQQGINEEFHSTSLAIGNIDNEPSKISTDKIVTGSFSGILRIYYPKASESNAADLLIESNLGHPILQVELGRFVPNSKELAIAVLTPRKLTVFTVASKNSDMTGGSEVFASGGGASSQDQSSQIKSYHLVEQYSHDLQRLAFNFCYGPFGGIYSADYICVQSFDGQLAFYEQDRLGFAVYLANFLVPGTIRYFRPLDAFLTFNSEMKIECYKYQTLKASMGSREKDENLSQGGKRVQVSWSVNVGEEIYDIRIARYSRYLNAAQFEILALGERSLFTIKDNGTISSQKRLDYFPSCMDLFTNADDKGQNPKHKLLIATHNKSLHVYKDPKLIWAAGTPSVPCQVRVGSFGGSPGMIVMLNDTGRLSVNYLGTDPATNPVPIMESKEFNYAEIETEHRKMQAIIRRARQAGRQEPDQKLVIKAQVPKNLDRLQQSSHTGEEPVRRATIKLYIGYTGERTLENISLTVQLPEPFTTIHKTIEISSLQGGSNRTPVIVPLMVMAPHNVSVVPHNLEAKLMGLYRGENGEPRTTTCKFMLPLILAGSIVPQKKSNTEHKILVQTNQPPPPLEQLFGDCFEGDANTQVGNSLTYKYVNGDDVTILVSKNAGRYRIQSNSFGALLLLVKELIRRLTDFFAESEQPFSASFPEAISFHDYFQVIETHFKCRRQLQKSMNQLKDRAHQFRSIQKRLLVRFKDRNPTPLNGMDLLFQETHNQLIQLSRIIEEQQNQLNDAQGQLTACTELICLLISVKHQMDDKETAVLRSHLSPVVHDNDEHGWEEVVDAGITHLLRTTLAKNARESGTAPQPLTMEKDTKKLQRHLALMYDRISKGMKIYVPPPKKTTKKKAPTKAPLSGQ